MDNRPPPPLGRRRAPQQPPPQFGGHPQQQQQQQQQQHHGHHHHGHGHGHGLVGEPQHHGHLQTPPHFTHGLGLEHLEVDFSALDTAGVGFAAFEDALLQQQQVSPPGPGGRGFPIMAGPPGGGGVGVGGGPGALAMSRGEGRSLSGSGHGDLELELDEEELGGGDGGEVLGETKLPGALSCRIVPDPPNLAEWREKLFNVDEPMILTHEEFETYFPHIDNVYSHRSTQKYKRKPFISHYWDCRMKGRPPGTPKSDDPNKKKRKRLARERDLCDVKIKITEYFPGATLNMLDLGSGGSTGAGPSSSPAGSSSSAAAAAAAAAAGSSAGIDGGRFWTIQRVNGNGGNGKGDGVAGPHKHSLDKSDEIKKNSVQRFLSAKEKELRRGARALGGGGGPGGGLMALPGRRTTGAAAATAKQHAAASDMRLYAACFCPFSQRVWIALEAKGLPYQYCETDPFMKPTQLLEANPRGLVPAIRAGDWACGESSVILEYLEDLDDGVRLFPTEPRLRANCRYWIDHVNSKIVPSFYLVLHATDLDGRIEATERLRRDLREFVDNADERGPFFLGAELSLVDIHLAPLAVRLLRVLALSRDWTNCSAGDRWEMWVEAIERNPHVQATTSTNELYLETVDLLLNSRQVQLDSLAAAYDK